MKNNRGKGNILEKDSVVLTTPTISDHIYQELKNKKFKNILDIGGERGNLSKPLRRKKGLKVHCVDVFDTYKDNFDTFIFKDFLETTKEDYNGLNIDLIVSNPPFQHHKEKGNLYPILFIEHILNIFPKNTPIVIIVPHYLLSNSSKRITILNNLNINKITTMQKTIFQELDTQKDINIEACILFINIKTKKTIDFLGFKKNIESTRKYKNVALNKAQQTFLNDKNITNFSKFVKDLIFEKYSEFPK